MSITKDEAVEALGTMTVMQLIALTKELEQSWGVKAEPQMVEFVPQEKQGPIQTEFTVVLSSVPADKKMTVIKLVREMLGMALKESKDLVEAVPKVIKEGVSKEDADLYKTRFTEAGAVIELK